MPEEVARKLGEANLMYATRRYKEAIDLLNDVIKEVCSTIPSSMTDDSFNPPASLQLLSFLLPFPVS